MVLVFEHSIQQKLCSSLLRDDVGFYIQVFSWLSKKKIALLSRSFDGHRCDVKPPQLLP